MSLNEPWYQLKKPTLHQKIFRADKIMGKLFGTQIFANFLYKSAINMVVFNRFRHEFVLSETARTNCTRYAPINESVKNIDCFWDAFTQDEIDTIGQEELIKKTYSVDAYPTLLERINHLNVSNVECTPSFSGNPLTDLFTKNTLEKIIEFFDNEIDANFEGDFAMMHDAVSVIDQLQNRNSLTLQEKIDLAIAYTNRNYTSLAIELLKEITEQDPENYFANYYFGSLLLSHKKSIKGYDYITKALKLGIKYKINPREKLYSVEHATWDPDYQKRWKEFQELAEKLSNETPID